MLCSQYKVNYCSPHQPNHTNPITNLIPAEIHNADSIPPALRLNHPPTIAPISSMMTAPARRFRLTFPVGPETSFGSLARSKYTLVSTTEGISLYPNALVDVILPALWNARSAIGINSKNSGPPVRLASCEVCGMRSASMRATAMMMRMDWMRKETKRVPRRRGPARRVVLEKAVAPRKKAAMETRDFSQPQGLLNGWEEAPRPRKIVFPLLC